MRIAFCPSEAPFDDIFIVVSDDRTAQGGTDHAGLAAFAGRWSARHRVQEMTSPASVSRAVTDALDAVPYEAELSLGNHIQVHILTGRCPIARRDGRVAYLEGVANQGQFPLSDEDARDLLLRPSVRWAGEPAIRGHFSALCGDGEQLTVFTDWLGLSQLFIARVQGMIVICNRLHLLGRVLQSLQGRVSVVPHVLAQSLLFDTTLGCQTMFDNVQLVPFHSHLVIDAGGVREKRHVDLADLARSQRSHYGDLLKHAQVEMRENWRALCAREEGKERVLYLTGGIDSRTALAVALAEDVPGLRYYTYGKRDSADRKLAAALAEHVGLPRVEDASPSIAGPVDAAVRWISLHYGQGTASLVPPRPAHTNRVQIRGATGETYRGYYTTLALDRGCTLQQVLDDEFLIHDLDRGPRKLVPTAVAAEIRRHVRSVYESEPLCTDTSAAVDALYLLYRNRHHFGLGMRSASFEVSQWAPLYSPSAVMASLLCNRMARLQGKVAYDLIRSLAPQLLLVDTTSPPWHPSATNDWAPLDAQNIRISRFTNPAPPLRSSNASADPQGLSLSQYEARLFDELPEVRTKVADNKRRLRDFLNVSIFVKRCDRAVAHRDAKLARACIVKGMLLLDVLTDE